MRPLLALAAIVLAIVARRRRVPEYETWSDYLAADDEGDALPPALRPDPYLNESFDWPDTGLVYWRERTDGRIEWAIQPIRERERDCE